MKHFLFVLLVMSSSLTMCMQRRVLANAKLLKAVSRFAAPARFSAGVSGNENQSEAKEEQSGDGRNKTGDILEEIDDEIKRAKLAKNVSLCMGVAGAGVTMGVASIGIIGTFLLNGPKEMTFIVGTVCAGYKLCQWSAQRFKAADMHRHRIYELRTRKIDIEGGMEIWKTIQKLKDKQD